MAFAVAIVDLKGSTQRSDAHRQLEALLRAIQGSAPGMFAQVAWGDEVEAVLPAPSDVWRLYVATRRFLGETPFYMGVGFGDLSEPWPLEGGASVHDLNGTAFKAARESVEAVKALDDAELALGFSVWGRANLTRALNGYPAMMNAAFRHMTGTQRAYARDLVTGRTQSAIGKRHGVSQSTVATVLKRAGMEQLPHMVDGLTALLEVVAETVGWGKETGAGR